MKLKCLWFHELMCEGNMDIYSLSQDCSCLIPIGRKREFIMFSKISIISSESNCQILARKLFNVRYKEVNGSKT